MSSSDALDAEAHATAVENVKPNIGRTTSKSAKNIDRSYMCISPHTPVACAVNQKFKNTEDNIVAATEACNCWGDPNFKLESQVQVQK